MLMPSRRATEARLAQLSTARRSLPPVPIGRSTAFLRGLRWLLPWTQYHYPGFRQGAADILHVSVGSLKHWIAGRRVVPVAVRHRLIEAIRARLDQGHAVLAELEAMETPAKESPVVRIQRARAKKLEALATLERGGNGSAKLDKP